MVALIDNVGGVEILIVFVVALLVFGRRLPEVAGQAGKQLVRVRRSLDAAWRDTGMEKQIREVQRDLESAIPRDLSIGDMARLASAEMEKRVQANEAEAARARPAPAGSGPVSGAEASPAPPEPPEAPAPGP